MNANRLKALITILDSGNYIVDVEKGEIRSKKRPKYGVLGYVCKKKGYVLVCLSDNGGHYYYHVHEVIAVAAGLDVLNMTVNHKSGNKQDNRIENLEVMTARDNIKHAWDTGLNDRILKRSKGKKKRKSTSEDKSKSKNKNQSKSKRKEKSA